jgi:hypothetical protein
MAYKENRNMAQKTRFEVGGKYQKREIEAVYGEFDVIDFTGRRDGKPVIKAVRGSETLIFVRDRGDKFILVA